MGAATLSFAPEGGMPKCQWVKGDSGLWH
jgi:hypothetical protein